MERLRKNAQFSDVYRAHHSFANEYIVMYVRNNGDSINRVGVSVSKKVGNSVVRHRVKRLLKEAFRTSEDMFNSGLDIVFVAKKKCCIDVIYRCTKISDGSCGFPSHPAKSGQLIIFIYEEILYLVDHVISEISFSS